MRHLLRIFVQDYGWIHTGLGLFGNMAFLAGSIAFLPFPKRWETVGAAWHTVGVWLFIVGASFMLVGALGNLLVEVFEARKKSGSGAS